MADILHDEPRALLIGSEFAIDFALLGPAIAFVPVIIRTLAIVLSMIVGQLVGAKNVDSVFAMAMALGSPDRGTDRRLLTPVDSAENCAAASFHDDTAR